MGLFVNPPLTLPSLLVNPRPSGDGLSCFPDMTGPWHEEETPLQFQQVRAQLLACGMMQSWSWKLTGPLLPLPLTTPLPSWVSSACEGSTVLT